MNNTVKYFKIKFFILTICFSSLIYSQTIEDTLERVFDAKEFLYKEKISISPDGKRCAFTLKQQPFVFTQQQLAQSDPIGSKIYLLDFDQDNICEMDGAVQGDCWHPSWSPDGAKIAFYSNASGQPQLWVYEIVKGLSHLVNPRTIKTSAGPLDTPVWSPDSKIVYVPLQPESEKLEQIENGVKIYKNEPRKSPKSYEETMARKEMNTELAAIDIASGDCHTLVPSHATPEPGYLTLSPSGKWIAYCSWFSPHENPLLMSFNLGVCPAHVSNASSIEDNIVIHTTKHTYYAWHPTIDLLAYVKDGILYVATFDASNGPIISALFQSSELKLLPNPLTFDKDGNIIVGAYWRKEICNIYPQAILSVPVSNPKNFKRINIDNGTNFKAVIKTSKEGITGIVHDHLECTTRAVRFDFGNKSKPTVLWSKHATLTNFHLRPGFGDYIFQYEDLNTPKSICRSDSEFEELEIFGNIGFESLGEFRTEKFETIVPFFNGEARKVKTTVIFPRGSKPGKPCPAIVMIYPGTDFSVLSQQFCGGNCISMPNLPFLEDGYALVLPDMTISPDGFAGNPVQEMTDVLLPQIRHAAQLGLIDFSKLGLIGQSYGAYGTAAVLTRTQIFKAGVAIAGLYDLPGNYGEFDDEVNVFYMNWSENGQGRMGVPVWESIFKYVENSPYYMADRIYTPLLLIHGEADNNCNVQEAKKMFTALLRLDREAILRIYPNQGHRINAWDKKSAVDATKSILDYFDTHLRHN